MNYNCLSCLPVGRQAQIKTLRTKGPLRRRLLDMGFTQDAFVTCLFESGDKGLRAYRIRGAVVALRQEDACQIELKQGGN